MMKPTKYLTLALTLALATFTTALMLTMTIRAEEDEDNSVDLSKMPAASLSALQARAGGTTIGKVEKNDEDGVVSYQAKFTVNGKKQEVTVDAAGKVVAEEVEVSTQEMPAAALAAIQNSVPGGAIVKAVKSTEHGKTTYEAKISLDGKTSEVKVTAAGGPVAEESEEGERHGKEGHEKD